MPRHSGGARFTGRPLFTRDAWGPCQTVLSCFAPLSRRSRWARREVQRDVRWMSRRNSITWFTSFFTCRLCHPRRPFPRGPGHLLVRVCPTDRDLLAVRVALPCRADQFGLGVRRRQQVPLYRDCLVRRSLQRVRTSLATLARPLFQADRAVLAVPSRKIKCS